MNLRARIRRWHSPTIFTLIALCFLLPFGTVFFVGGCGGTNLNSSTKFTGVQLVTGTVPHGGRDPDCKRDISICVERAGGLVTDLAFGAAIVGLFLGLLGVARGPGWCAAVGLGALLVLPLSLMNLAEDNVSLHTGYPIALLLLLWAGVLHLLRAAKRVRTRRDSTGPPFLWGHPRIGPSPYEGDPYV